MTVRPILFLDIDGVLNSIAWQTLRESTPRDPMYGQLSREDRDADRSLDPDAVLRLNRIVDRTDCLIVLSSSWRKQYPLPTVTRMLRRRGFRYRLFGCTPSVFREGKGRSAHERGNEIACWLEDLGLLETARIAIVDDDSDMEPFMDRLVKTDHQVGLTDANADRLIELLTT